MNGHDAARIWCTMHGDAYTLWFNAHSRCTHALRAWSTAAPARRASAYRAYLDELALEEEAAGMLERLHVQAAA